MFKKIGGFFGWLWRKLSGFLRAELLEAIDGLAIYEERLAEEIRKKLSPEETARKIIFFIQNQLREGVDAIFKVKKEEK